MEISGDACKVRRGEPSSTELVNRLCSGYVVSADWQRIADFLSADHIASCTEHGEVRAMRYTYRSFDLAREYALLQYKDITDIRAKERMLEKAQRDSVTDQRRIGTIAP